MQFTTKLSLLVFLASSICQADRIKLLENNAEALQTRVALIESAQEEILFEYFEVADDPFSALSLGLLRAAAERGVQVKILIDSLNNHLTRAEMAAVLGISKTSPALKNIEIRVFNPPMILNPYHLTYRNHDKLLNIDHHTMIIGGRNAAETYFGKSKTINFKDVDALVVGEVARKSYFYFMSLWKNNPDVRELNLYDFSERQLSSFCEPESDYFDCEQKRSEAFLQIDKANEKINTQLLISKSGKLSRTSKSLAEIEFTAEEVGDISFAFNDPTQTIEDVDVKIEKQLIDLLLETKKSLLITTPYLYPTEAEFKVFEKLAARGVKIKIITNSLASTNKVLAHAGYLSIQSRLAALGAELHLFKGPEVLHAKGFVIDDKVSFIGSFNFDPRSALLNREIGIIVGNTHLPTSHFTARFMKFINSELFGNSVTAVKNKIEYDLSKFDAKNTRQRKESLEKMKDLVPLLKSQI